MRNVIEGVRHHHQPFVALQCAHGGDDASETPQQCVGVDAAAFEQMVQAGRRARRVVEQVDGPVRSHAMNGSDVANRCGAVVRCGENHRPRSVQHRCGQHGAFEQHAVLEEAAQLR